MREEDGSRAGEEEAAALGRGVATGREWREGKGREGSEWFDPP